jgi:hypothetical protein
MYKCTCIKLSQEVEKLVIPGRKTVYRLYGKDGKMGASRIFPSPVFILPTRARRVINPHPSVDPIRET